MGINWLKNLLGRAGWVGFSRGGWDCSEFFQGKGGRDWEKVFEECPGLVKKKKKKGLVAAVWKLGKLSNHSWGWLWVWDRFENNSLVACTTGQKFYEGIGQNAF